MYFKVLRSLSLLLLLQIGAGGCRHSPETRRSSKKEFSYCEVLFDHALESLSESYAGFDQNPRSGWRVLAEQQCYGEAARLIETYLGNNQNLEEWQAKSLTFHAGQMLAYGGRNPQALEFFLQSLYHEEPRDNPIRWNAYVRATIAFLTRDRGQLQKYREEIAGAPKVEGNIAHLAVVDTLMAHYGGTYREAYEALPKQ